MPTKSLVKRTRKPRDPFKPKVEKELSHVTAEQVLQRHIYCISISSLVGSRDVAETTSRLAAKGQLHGYCDHPQDGWCQVGNFPTTQELEEINNRLSGKGSETSRDMSNPVQVRIPRKRSEVKAVTHVSYFCMKCEDWHSDIDGVYITHMEFKRKRGQRLLSQLKPKEPAKYFCTKCDKWHRDDDFSIDGPSSSTPGVIRSKVTGIYKSHIKYKRKRGRQKGWQFKQSPKE